MTPADLISPITGSLGAVTLPNAEDWMQGRTFYGGASALIAYTAAIRAFPALPPLRSAQIGFVAPFGGEVELSATIIRQGRNVAQVRSEIRSEGEVALTAFWLFGTSRDANAVFAAAGPDTMPAAPEEVDSVMTEKGPNFLRNHFELRRGQDERGPGKPLVRRWARLKEHSQLDPVSELVLIGDVLPPGAMRTMQRRGPISSINWTFNVLDTAPATRDGWWLSENTSQFAGEGYSSERMRIWNANGKQMLDGMQCVAIFG